MGKTLLLLFSVLLIQSNVLSQNGQIKKDVLNTIIEKSKTSHTDAMVIYQDGKLIGEWYSGTPGKIELMSVTKSVVNLGVGKLIDEGKIKSLDQPVADFYPEWNQGEKKSITIRALLNHTSGLQNHPNAGIELEPARDLVQLALAAELSDKPNTKFSYNNKAVNLLAGVIEKASGKKMDVYFREAIFQPLGITDFNWLKDPAGNPVVMAGLQLTAKDTAKIGQLLLNRGIWEGRRIISENWIDKSVKQGQPFDPNCGLLWWRVFANRSSVIDDAKFQELEAAKVSSDFLAKVTPLRNIVYKSDAEYSQALKSALGDDWIAKINNELGEKRVSLSRKIYGEPIGYNANGYLGQYIVIIPKSKIVAIRQIKRSDSYNSDTDGFNDFISLVATLAE